jgi:hypothetical protein
MNCAWTARFAQNFIFALLVVSGVFCFFQLAEPRMGVKSFLLQLLELLFQLFGLSVKFFNLLVRLSLFLLSKRRQLFLLWFLCRFFGKFMLDSTFVYCVSIWPLTLVNAKKRLTFCLLRLLAWLGKLWLPSLYSKLELEHRCVWNKGPHLGQLLGIQSLF